MEDLVSVDWLTDHLGDDDLVVLDCTVFLQPSENKTGYVAISGHEHFDKGHIPGAALADLCSDLCDTTSEFRFMVPTPEQFADAMGRLGVGDDSRVVLYDVGSAMWAARVWWMLRWIGFDNAAILDGGWKAWKSADGEIATDATAPAPKTLTPNPRPELIASKADVLAAINDGATCLIDALGPEQFRGEQQTYGRPGHIPGAVNAPAMALLDPNTGRFRSLTELAMAFPSDKEARTVTYCGGGIAASADAFVLHRLGFTDIGVYTASLQEWINDPDAPLVTGAQ